MQPCQQVVINKTDAKCFFILSRVVENLFPPLRSNMRHRFTDRRYCKYFYVNNAVNISTDCYNDVCYRSSCIDVKHTDSPHALGTCLIHRSPADWMFVRLVLILLRTNTFWRNDSIPMSPSSKTKYGFQFSSLPRFARFSVYSVPPRDIL